MACHHGRNPRQAKLIWFDALDIALEAVKEGTELSLGKHILTVVFVALVVLAIPVYAVDYNAGVKKGEWIEYSDFRASTTGTQDSSIAVINSIDWLKLEVKEVSGTTVTVETTIKYKDSASPVPPSQNTVDTSTPLQSTVPYLYVPLVAANLSEGDQLQTLQGSIYRVNGSVTSAYCSGMRSVNYLDVTMSYSGGSGTLRIHWDKATGVLLETYMSTTTTAPSQSSEISFKAVETNMWSPDLLGSLMNNLLNVVGIVMLIVVIVIIILIAAGGKRTATVRKPAPESAPIPTEETKQA